MTESSRPDTQRTDAAEATSGRSGMLAGALAQARRVLLWERLWPPVVGLAAALGLFLAASWADLWSYLPPAVRPFVLFGFIALAAYAGAPLLRLRRPGRRAALRRLDSASGQLHRPASALDDQLGSRPDDPVSCALWEAHRARVRAAAGAFRPGLPHPRLIEHDRLALRALVALLLVATFFMAEGERVKRVLLAFDWTGPAMGAPYRVDAWVTPPAYTGRPPLLLSGVRSGEPVANRNAGAIEVPAGSIVTVRATGLDHLTLRARGGFADAPPQAGAAPPIGTLERSLIVTGSGRLSLHDVGDADLEWSFLAVLDRPPVITLTREAKTVGRGALSLGYRLEDDYGVTAAEARLTLRDQPAAARPLYALPPLPLSLPQARTRAGAGETVKDLTDHPFAGARMALMLAARDDAGNEGVSEIAELALPQRSFADPLARALAEQRRVLALDAGRSPAVARALDALAIAPERFTPDAGIYLGLRSAWWRLANARDDDGLREVVELLWEMAVQLEDGDMADAERALRAAEDALRQALERGATDDELKQLTDNLRQALDRFMRELAEQLQRNRDSASNPLDRNSRMLRPQDLQALIDKLEGLARSGARDAARRMLDELQAMLDSIDRRRAGDMAGPDGDRDALDDLGDMIRNQQQLRDRTWREGRDKRQRRDGAPGQSAPNQSRPNQGAPNQGAPNQKGPSQPGSRFGDLQHNQEELRQKLDQLLGQLQRRSDSGDAEGESGSQALGRARDAMREAEQQLGNGNADGAVESQGQALENLRRGAQSLAQSQGEGRGMPNGRSAAGESDTDPLGRPRGGRNDPDVQNVPDVIEAQRARRVLEELRRRLGELERPQLERDYLERLLRGF